MMMEQNNRIMEVSFSPEELALCLGLINRFDLGEGILDQVYHQPDQDQVRIILTGAGHSLIARGLGKQRENGTLILAPAVEEMIFPLAKFDQLFQIQIVEPDRQINALVHVIKKRSFCVHLIKPDGSHYLEYGVIDQLGNYLVSIFPGFGAKPGNSSVVGRIQLEKLNKLLLAFRQSSLSDDWFLDLGWEREIAQRLKQDWIEQKYRATLLRLDNSSESSVKDIQSKTGRTLLLLQTVQWSWLFDFPTNSPQAEAQVSIVSPTEFQQVISDWIN